MSDFEFNGNNYVLHYDDFYISYNENPCAGMPFFGSDEGSDEAINLWCVLVVKSNLSERFPF